MFLNYLITAWRNLLKFRAVSAINILGLTLGLASAVLAIMYARHELTYENSHDKADRICRIYTKGNFGEVQQIPTTLGPEGEALKNMFPEIEAYTISRSMSTTVRAGENLFIEDDIIFSDSMAFGIFTIPFMEGNISHDPQTVVLSEKAAVRYFGEGSPVGKSISINCYGTKWDFLVTGVFEDFPSNTHLQGEFIIPFSFSKRFGFWKSDEYQSTSYNSYVLLRPGTDVKELNKKIAVSYKIPVEAVENISSFLMPLKEIHFKGTWQNNKGKLIVLLIGGLFVLITSCLNYINLTNILFSARAKETGIRKINGGNRKHIFSQFLVDTLLSTLISFNLAIILLKIVLPLFNAQMDTHISLNADGQAILLMIAIFMVTVLFSGMYPALRYSARRPVMLLRMETVSGSDRAYSRWILTTFQFILAVVFIQVMLVMDRQNRYLYREDVTGFNAENVLCISGYPWGDLKKVKTELLKNPSVEMVSWGNVLPSAGYRDITKDWGKQDNDAMATLYDFEPDYMNLYQIKILSGRFFSDDFPSDRETGMVINKKAADILGYDDAVNKSLRCRGKEYTIIGVIDNYMAEPPIFDNMPTLITQSRELNEFLMIRINPENREATKEFITKTLKQFNADYPIELKYHYEIIFGAKETRSYISATNLMHVFFIITIITSLIGIFGLSLFILQKNQKKVGILKVCGASVTTIVAKLTRGMIIQVILAFIIATPLAWLFTLRYLSVFPKHFKPGFLLFLTGGLMALTMVLITVSWQTWKTALGNPVESLKYE